jgi:hypothetical protein
MHNERNSRQKFGGDPIRLEAALIGTLGKPVIADEHLDIHARCAVRGWNKSRVLFSPLALFPWRAEAG